MDWIQLSIIHSFIVASLIIYIRYDKTPFFIFPIVVNIIVGLLSIIYFIYYYNEHFVNEFCKPIYYIYSIAVLVITILGYYIIKISPNPAYFRTFVALEIILLLIITLYINNTYNISTQTMIGLLLGCASIILISLDDSTNKLK